MLRDPISAYVVEGAVDRVSLLYLTPAASLLHLCTIMEEYVCVLIK